MVTKRKGCGPGKVKYNGKCRNPDDIVGKCHNCGMEFTVQNFIDASKGTFGSPVGDWDFVCYPCEFKKIDDGTWAEWSARMREIHPDGTCNHIK